MGETKARRYEILFVIDVDEKRVSFSPSAVHSSKETYTVDIRKVANKVGSALKIGDRIIGNLQRVNGDLRIVVEEIQARRQPTAISEKDYLKLLKIQIDDRIQPLDFDALNDILRPILGITVRRAETLQGDCDLLVNVVDADPGTNNYQLEFIKQSGLYPLKIDFPRTSEQTKKYLKMIKPNGNITDTRVFGYRLVHYLLHRLGYHDHFSRELEVYKRQKKAIDEGDPSQIPALDEKKPCLCDWELVHLLSTQESSPYQSYDKMLCDDCTKLRTPVGVGIWDFGAILGKCIASSKSSDHIRNERHILYIAEKNEYGLVLNGCPYKSRTTVSALTKDWISLAFDAYRALYNIFVPRNLLVTKIDVHEGDKVLVDVKTQARLDSPNDQNYFTKAVSFEIIQIIRRRIKIFDPSSLLLKIRPFSLNVVLRVGPNTDLEFVKKVAEIVHKTTTWRVKVDRSCHERLTKAFQDLDSIREKWKNADPTARNDIVANARKIINGLAPERGDVEDNFNAIVYIFPEKYTFLEDVFGSKAYGEALYRLYAVVGTYPSSPPKHDMQKPCDECARRPLLPLAYRQNMTAIFVIHEILHISSGLEDHRECSLCHYGREEMRPFHRIYCEDCIREGNDVTHRNCLMSYTCLQCLATRLSQGTLSDFLCEKCKKLLMPEEKFVARQAARVNSLIYQNLLFGKNKTA